MRNYISIALKGLLMGMAEIVPGVSGGTIAFITGIYERLLNAIKAANPKTALLLLKGEFVVFWQKLDGNFLLALLIGMAAGIVIGVTGISWLLDNQPIFIWSFFFGLIIASVIYIGRQVSQWNFLSITLLIIGAVIAFIITLAAPANGNEALWYVFISGAIAISALILPGISGSFILLLMGMYTYIIPLLKSVLKTFDTSALLVIAVFGAGCFTGLMSISRLLSWTFKNYKNNTLALLTGFMMGSLNKIWPWRIPTNWTTDEHGMMDKVLSEANLLPAQYLELTGNEPQLFVAIIATITGFALVFVLDKFSISGNK